MNKLTRILAMSGMGLLAGLTFGAGPAQASATTAGPSAQAATGHTVQVQQYHGRDRVAGYYRSRLACEYAGRLGERFNRWDDHDCNFVPFGFHRRTWVLTVERDWDFGRPFWTHNSGSFGPGWNNFDKR